MIPALEVDTYIANLLGLEYKVPEGDLQHRGIPSTSTMSGKAGLFGAEVTSSVRSITPIGRDQPRRDGKRIVTVGYVPTATNNATGELSLTAPTKPTKYMDYVFTRGENRPSGI